MSAESEAFPLEESKTYRGIFWGGLIAGSLDISAAFVNSGLRGRSPIWVLQSVAGGLLGPDTFKGGAQSAVLGAVVHFFIAFSVCAFYFAVSRKLKFLVEQPIVCGVLYGVAVYLFMYLVVLPLTFHRSFVTPLSAVVVGLMIHIICIGLPISLIVSRSANKKVRG